MNISLSTAYISVVGGRGEKVSEILKDSKVIEFARFETGEGIEKVESDFAAEVAAQLK